MRRKTKSLLRAPSGSTGIRSQIVFDLVHDSIRSRAWISTGIPKNLFACLGEDLRCFKYLYFTDMDVSQNPSVSELAGRIVQAWALRAEAIKSEVARFRSVLSPEETYRAASFRFDDLRSTFILARACVRILLGSYLGIAPAAVQFKYGIKGKPSVLGGKDLQFNVSHSGGLAVFAFTLGCDIGIDIEQVRSLSDIQDIADRFFSVEEASELMSVPNGQRLPAFFRCWTRKEAYVKAIGDGLSAPLNEFRVTIGANEPARLIHVGIESRG
jgi:4'-phosphopantetheinyl transferase